MVPMLHGVLIKAQALLYGLGLCPRGRKRLRKPILSVECTQRQIVREDHKGSAPATDGRLARFRLSQSIKGPAQ
jgi:hypothetical protein